MATIVGISCIGISIGFATGVNKYLLQPAYDTL